MATQSTANGSTTLTSYIGSIEEVQTTGSSTQTTTYYAVGGKRVAADVNGTFYYFGYDALGSQMAVLNATGSLVGAQLYGPYGASRYNTGTLPTSIGFTGQRADSVTGLDYYNARYYDPGVGQFLSVDSVQGNRQGMDPYAYVGGNPESRTDPTGNHPTCSDDGSCNDGAGGGNTGGSGGGAIDFQPPRQNNGGDTTQPTPTPNGRSSGGSDCGGGTHWTGSQCVANSDHTPAKKNARNNKLMPGVILSIGLLVTGGILILLSNFIAMKFAVDNGDLPAIIGTIADTISILSEIAGAISIVNQSIAAVAFGLLAVFHGALAMANGVLSVYDAVIGGLSWLKGVIQPVLKVIGITLQGAPGVLFDLAKELLGKAIVFGTRTLGHTLMAVGNAGLAVASYQESMNIDSWCTQYGQDEAACTAS